MTEEKDWINIAPQDQFDPSGILADREKGIYHTLASPQPISPVWEKAPARPLSEVLWIEDENLREKALKESLPPQGTDF